MIRSLVTLFAAVLTSLVMAGGPVSWTFSPTVTADGKVAVQLKAVCEAGWHIYALTLPRDDGPFPTVITTMKDDAYVVQATHEPAPEEVDDPNFGMQVRYHSGTTVFEVVLDRTTDKSFTVKGQVEFMCCNDKMCLPPSTVPFTLTIPAAK